MLPNDPLLVDLSQFQKLWIVQNMLEDMELANPLGKKVKKGDQQMGLSEDEFKTFSAEMKLKAKEQARGRTGSARS